MLHRNPTLSTEARRFLNAKSNEDTTDQALLVVPFRPPQRIVRRGSALDATSGTVFTTPTDKDFYLCSAVLAMATNNTATSTSSSMSVVIDGVTVTLLEIRHVTLTPDNIVQSQAYDPPILLDRGSLIALANSTAVGTITTAGTITGYTLETG